MRVALVFSPFTHKIFSENLRVVDEEFCLSPPIILAYVAAILERAGHKVILIDAHALKLSKEKTLKILNNFKPDLLGFRLETYHLHQTLDWARYLKLRLDVPVIAGGINFSIYPEESLRHSVIDYSIIGDAIESLPKLVHALEKGQGVSNIEGVGYRNNGIICLNPPSKKVTAFDDYPFPARHLLSNDKYHSFISQRRNFTIMVTSRGCPYKCVFCAIAKIPYQERSPQNVVDEIEECYQNYGIREIDIFDPVFFLNRNRILQIFNEIHKRGIKIEWSCRSRVDVVDEEILKEAARAGCRQIYYGIESSSPQILKGIDKKINPGQVKEAIRMSREYGIRTMGFFMFGAPGETRQTIKETIRFSKQLGLDFVQVCRTIAKPSTELNEIIKKETGVDYWKEYVLGRVSQKRFPIPWTSLTEKEIEKGVREAYYSFYFRPSLILRTILRIRSLAELARYIRVALRMIFLRSS